MPIGLDGLFEPKFLIIVGVSEPKKGEERYSRCFCRLVRNLSGFKEKLQIVDLSGKLPESEKDLKKIKGKDLAIVVLPRNLMTKNFQKILSRAKAILLISDEIESKQLDKLCELSKRRKLLFLGPASFGVMNPEIGLIATVSGGLGAGEIGIISQNRSVTSAIINTASELRKNVSKVACIGEGAGVNETDLIDYLTKDKKTAVICVYVETLRDGRGFIGAVKKASMEKPILILKGGKVQKVFKHAVIQARGILVENIEEMLVGAETLSKQPPMPGKKVAIVTNYYGQGMLALRYLNEKGLSPARLSEEVSKKLLKKDARIKIGEFVDIGVSANADHYKFVVDQLLSDEGVDGVMVICGVGLGQLEADELPKVMEKKPKNKPILGVALFLEKREDILDALTRARTPVCGSVKTAVTVLKISSLRHEILLSFEKISTG
jgi:acyl-CoA synthetase (NDP forming)